MYNMLMDLSWTEDQVASDATAHFIPAEKFEINGIKKRFFPPDASTIPTFTGKIVTYYFKLIFERPTRI